MGAMQNNGDPGKAKRVKRGSVRNKDRLEAFGGTTKEGHADWGGCDERRLQGVVIEITSLGGAVTFGLSRDKGAHMLTLLLDDDKRTLWFNGDSDLNEELDAVVEKLKSMS